MRRISQWEVRARTPTGSSLTGSHLFTKYFVSFPPSPHSVRTPYILHNIYSSLKHNTQFILFFFFFHNTRHIVQYVCVARCVYALDIIYEPDNNDNERTAARRESHGGGQCVVLRSFIVSSRAQTYTYKQHKKCALRLLDGQQGRITVFIRQDTLDGYIALCVGINYKSLLSVKQF